MNSEENGEIKNPIAAVVDEMTPRKTSKRMEKVRQASLVQGKTKTSALISGHVVRSNGSAGDVHEKQGENKHEVSLKNIVFEGSQRRMSALHPSQKLSIKGSNGHIEPNELRVVSIKKLSTSKNQMEAAKSQDNVLS